MAIAFNANVRCANAIHGLTLRAWWRSRCVVYVSCNAVTQRRDLEALLSGGYRLMSLTPVDMFPHTKHVETVILMSRIRD